MASKWKKRIKKALKTAAKAAAVGTAAYGASKLFGGKGRRAANLASSYANVRDRHVPYDINAINKGILAQQHDSESAMVPNKPKWYEPNFFKGWSGKKGGRVTGIAKRGFGRALMKGKK